MSQQVFNTNLSITFSDSDNSENSDNSWFCILVVCLRVFILISDQFVLYWFFLSPFVGL